MQSSPVKMHSERHKHNRAIQFVYDWAANNIFLFRKWDGTLYVLLYILTPVFITLISLNTLRDNLIVAEYCYFSIMISAANCFYDTLGRWDKRKLVKKIKLAIIQLASGAIFIYGFFEFLAVSISQTLDFRQDAILCLYLPAIAVATIDVVALISREIDFMNAIRN